MEDFEACSVMGGEAVQGNENWGRPGSQAGLREIEILFFGKGSCYERFSVFRLPHPYEDRFFLFLLVA